MQKMELCEVARKLIGPTHPAGDASIDDKRLENLKEKILLVDELIDDLIDIASYANDYRHSMKEAGSEAVKFFERHAPGFRELVEEHKG